MRSGRVQFGVKLLAIAASVAIPVLCAGQNPHPDRPPQRQAPAPQGQTHAAPNRQPASRQGYPQPTNPNRPGNANRSPYKQAHPNQGPRNNFNNGANNHNGVRNGAGAGYAPTPRRQLGVGAPRPWVDQMRDLSPQQRERVLQNSKAFQNLSPDKQGRIRQQFNQWDNMPPSQRADLRQKENTWRNLTPDQREHIKNDVLPRWRQMPWDRQQVMKQKLGVLQNMPESARNQRLNDPNFTRGLSEEERSTLQDLSHTHVGAPDPPGE
ncbi:MAG TPA: DUF3106 domain-containing protein [Candidatus Acidoferrum sp.]|nr:DUF3106 domain-containing protein [Candidatus Acidoferrum sp.]